MQIVIQCGRKAMFPCHSQHGGIAGGQSMLVGKDGSSKVVCAWEILVVVLFPYSAVLIDALKQTATCLLWSMSNTSIKYPVWQHTRQLKQSV
jgi:hypothetical protein